MTKPAKRWIAALLLTVGAGMQIGCQACGSCYDYSSPVSGYQCSSCGQCGDGRTGSRLSGLASNETDAAEYEVQVAGQPTEELVR